jgi:maltokinase-like protein
VAVIHHTTLAPTKLELLTEWLPTRPWYRGQAPQLTAAGGFRLDDPAGEVGIEFMVVTDRAGEAYLTPMAYRDAPAEGQNSALIGTMQHGVLGKRWVYDGTADPVVVAQLLAAIRGTAQPQAQKVSNTADPSVQCFCENLPELGDIGPASDGPSGTDIAIGSAVLRLNRVLGAGDPAAGTRAGLVAGWSQNETTVRGVFATIG